ncbi:MAG: hypothetical protein IKB38_07695 [Clostridia bacterium]|nr:hypothetical protein [Clostridia bacterium]
MTKRIIALILVIVMSVLTLFGCGEYDYADADLDDFSTVYKDKLLSAFAGIQIEDEEDFSADPETRKKEVYDIILRSLLNADNANDEEYTEGTPDFADALYYSYYAVYEDDDGVKHVINVPKTSGKTDYVILPNNKTYLQFGVKGNADDALLKAIEEKFAAIDIKDYAYDLNKNEDDDGHAGKGNLKVEAGKTVLLTFTYTDAEGKTKDIKNLVCQIPAEKPADPTVDALPESAKSLADLLFFENFLYDLVGKNVGAKLSASTNKFEYEFELPTTETPAPADSEGGEEAPKKEKVSYTSVTVTGIVEGTAVEVDVVYPDDEKKEFTDLFGTKVDLKGKDVTYFVYPVHIKKVDYVDVDVLEDADKKAEAFVNNATAILTVFYGSQSVQDLLDDNGKATGEKVGALDIFTNEEYKITYEEGEGESKKEVTKTFKELMLEFTKVQKAYEDAKAALDKAEDAFEKAEKALKKAEKDYFDMKDITIPGYEEDIKFYNAEKTLKQEYLEKIKAATDLAALVADLEAEIAALEAIEDETEKAEKKDELTIKKDILKLIKDATDLSAAEKALGDDITVVEKDIKTTEEALADAKLDLDGDPNASSAALKKGFKGVYEDAVAAFKTACKTLNAHKDDDNNCVCDICEAELDTHVDEPVGEEGAEVADCKCDKCEALLKHVDEDKDGKCDTCKVEFVEDDNKDRKTVAEAAKSAIAAEAEALEKRDAFVNDKLFKVKKYKDDAEVADASITADICDAFKDSVYDVLEDEYFEAINEKIKAAVVKIIYSEEYITVDRENLPRKAVNEIYDRIYDGYKAEFFGSEKTYDQYSGDFEAYLMVKTGMATFKEAKNAIKAEAKEYVAKIVKIYQVARVLGVTLQEEEFEATCDEFRQNQEYMEKLFKQNGLEYNGELDEQSIHIAEQADKLLDYLFKTKTDDKRVATQEKNGKIYFVYENCVSYSVK